MNDHLGILNRYGFQYESLDKEVGKLPIVYKKKYNFTYLNLFKDQEVLLISRSRDISLELFVQDSLFLSKRLEVRVVLLTDELNEDDLSRLISSNIPFISKDSLFLPFLGAVIEEINKPIPLRKTYSINQQRVLINILLNSKNTISAERLVSDLDISIASVYRVLKYFSELEYIKSIHGEYIYLKKRNEIFQDSISSFLDPVEVELYVPRSFITIFDNLGISYFNSGIDALSSYTMLASNNEGFGVSENDISKLLDKIDQTNLNYSEMDDEILSAKKLLALSIKRSVKSLYRYSDDIKLQVWKYSPIMLSDKVMDPINLSILKIDADQDPRVEEALEELKQYVYNLLEELDNSER